MKANITLSNPDFSVNIDWRVPLRKSGSHMYGSIAKNFQSQGRPQKWKALSPRTLQQRRRRRNFSQQILVDTGRLRGSITTREHGDGIYKLSDKQLVIGTKVPYGIVHQKGGVHVPKRQFVGFQEKDITDIVKIFTDHIVKTL